MSHVSDIPFPLTVTGSVIPAMAFPARNANTVAASLSPCMMVATVCCNTVLKSECCLLSMRVEKERCCSLKVSVLQLIERSCEELKVLKHPRIKVLKLYWHHRQVRDKLRDKSQRTNSCQQLNQEKKE